jgi:hypothetical protein
MVLQIVLLRKVCTATSYELDNLGVGVRVQVGTRIFASYCANWLCGTPYLLSNGYRGALSSGVKRQDREANYSPPTSAKVKKTRIYTFIPP